MWCAIALAVTAIVYTSIFGFLIVVFLDDEAKNGKRLQEELERQRSWNDERIYAITRRLEEMEKEIEE